MSIPKCGECEFYRISEPLDHFFNTETCASNHNCCNPKALKAKREVNRHIPQHEIGDDSPKWCPKKIGV